MKSALKKPRVSIQEQLVRAEQDYLRSLEKDNEFSILKGLRNIIKDLKSRLEKNPPADKT